MARVVEFSPVVHIGGAVLVVIGLAVLASGRPLRRTTPRHRRPPS